MCTCHDLTISTFRSWNLFKDKVDRFYDFARESHLTLWKDDQNGIKDHLNNLNHLNGEMAYMYGIRNARPSAHGFP